MCNEQRADYLKAQAILDEVGLKIYLAKPLRLHKQILGEVGDRFGIGMERMKQIAKSGTAAVNKAVKKIARSRKSDTE